MVFRVSRTIRVTITLDGTEHSLNEDEALGLARGILAALGKKESSRASRTSPPVEAVTGEWSEEDTRFVVDGRAQGKTWVLLGELVGRTASEVKTHHDRVVGVA